MFLGSQVSTYNYVQNTEAGGDKGQNLIVDNDFYILQNIVKEQNWHKAGRFTRSKSEYLCKSVTGMYVCN